MTHRERSRAVARRLCWLTPLLAGPGVAHAHLVSTGLGPLYDGIGHFLVTLEDLLVVLAVGLLAGVNGPLAGRRVLVALPVAWLAAGFIGYAASPGQPSPLLAVPMAALLGSGLALGMRLSPLVMSAIAALAGLVHGFVNGATLMATARPLREILGTVLAVLILIGPVAALPVRFAAPWVSVVCRVVGAWIVAIGVLWFGWLMRG
jgi:hydrogenase/urease accessory protein HupE